MPRIPNRRDDDREPIAPAPIAEAPPAPATPLQPVVAPAGDPSLPPSAADEVAAEIADPVAAGEEGAPPPTSAPLPPIIPTEAHEAEADLLLADAEDPPRAAPARGWRADAERVYRMVSDELLLATGGKRLPTIEEIDRAIDGAVARTTAQHPGPEAGPPPAAPISAPEIEAATNRLAAKALDPAWADDPEAVARSRRWVRDMLHSGASEDEVQGMLAQTGTRDWLNRYAAKLGDDWDDPLPRANEDAGGATFTLAAWQPGSPAAPTPPASTVNTQSPVGSTPAPQSSAPSGGPLSQLPDAAAVQSMLADPQRQSQYIELEHNLPARLNHIALNGADFRAAANLVYNILEIMPDDATIAARKKKAEKAAKKAAEKAAKLAKKMGINVAPTAVAPPASANSSGQSNYGDSQDAEKGGKTAWQSRYEKLNAKPMYFRMKPPVISTGLRAFSYDAGATTVMVKANAIKPGERYVGIAERISDGTLHVVSMATGGKFGGSMNGMAGFPGGPPLPDGFVLRALLHTHDTKKLNAGAIPGPGDPSAAWGLDIAVYVASYTGDVNKPFDPSQFTIYEISRVEKSAGKDPRLFEYSTEVNEIDAVGNAWRKSSAETHVSGWKFKNWKVKTKNINHKP